MSHNKPTPRGPKFPRPPSSELLSSPGNHLTLYEMHIDRETV